MKPIKYDNPVCRLLTQIVDIIILNFLWVLCSVPIITMGSATAALYYSYLKINREEDSTLSGMFFHSFRQNLRQGCIMTVMFVLCSVLLFVDCSVYVSMDGIVSYAALAGLILLILALGMVSSYAVALLAQFDNPIKVILKNAFLLGIINMKYTIPIVLLNAIPFVLLFKLPYIFIACVPLFLICGVSLTAFINSKFFTKIFRLYVDEDNTSE